MNAKQVAQQAQAVASILHSCAVRLREAGVADATLEAHVRTPLGGVLTLTWEEEGDGDDDDDDEDDEMGRPGGPECHE